MPINHGVYTSEKATSVANPIKAESGVPIVFGTAPVQAADSPAAVGMPTLVEGWSDFVKKFGYSDDWTTYTLCEFAYSHFKLFGVQPAIFVNVLNPASMKTTVNAADKTVSAHRVALPIAAINDASLVVKAEGGGGDAYVKGTDYDVFYDGEYCYVELLDGGACYDATKVSVAYSAITIASINAAAIATAMENIELCMTKLGLVPDLIVAPGWSSEATVAAVMSTKAAGINGMFQAKALIDLTAAANSGYTAAISAKNASALSEKVNIVCWPLVKLGDKTFHLSTQLAGLMAQVDSNNGGSPYESPSNKKLVIDALVDAGGNEINLTHAQANVLNAAGIVTAINFMGGFRAWGNYTAAYPNDTDVKDTFIPISRMFDWVGNTVRRTFWSILDAPMNRRLIDTVTDQVNVWMNALTGAGQLLGGRAEYLEDENPTADLMQGIIRMHLYITPPGPAQELDYVLEYDASYVTAAFSE